MGQKWGREGVHAVVQGTSREGSCQACDGRSKRALARALWHAGALAHWHLGTPALWHWRWKGKGKAKAKGNLRGTHARGREGPAAAAAAAAAWAMVWPVRMAVVVQQPEVSPTAVLEGTNEAVCTGGMIPSLPHLLYRSRDTIPAGKRRDDGPFESRRDFGYTLAPALRLVLPRSSFLCSIERGHSLESGVVLHLSGSVRSRTL